MTDIAVATPTVEVISVSIPTVVVTVAGTKEAIVLASNNIMGGVAFETKTTSIVSVNPGTPGPVGPMGPSAGVEFTFLSPSGSWLMSVPASFGRRPSVAIYGLDGSLVLADIHTSTTQVVATFAAPFAGYAELT